jgi:hypothetical protein
MQIFDLFMFLQYPSVLLLLGIAVVLPKRSKKPGQVPLDKAIRTMLTAIDKGKTVTAPATKSRLEIVTDLFESKMRTIGLEPSLDSGHVPVGLTPLATYLQEHGVSEEIVSAMLAGIREATSESEILDMINAAAESKDFALRGADLNLARELAVLEWAHTGHDRS